MTPSSILALPSRHRSLSYPPPSPSHSVPKRRRRRSGHPADNESELIIGHLTVNAKFKCSFSNCYDLSYGRQADLRRHYDHQHADRRLEFFCTFDGCTRSKNPAGKSKGKSFGSREDKMKEHYRNVHDKLGKRKRFSAADNDEEGQEECSK
jgi:hypothetical protein